MWNSWEILGSDEGNGGKVDINPTWHKSLVGIREEWIFLDNRKVKYLHESGRLVEDTYN
jgi:hypothetical protein